MTESPKECTLYGSDPRENSMLFWYPKLANLDVPTPMTRIARVHKNTWELSGICDGDFSALTIDWDNIVNCANTVGWPVFMRTDEMSAKHEWTKTCYVEKVEDLQSHIGQLTEQSLCADLIGLPIRAFVFRQYIEMDCIFKAFEGMPVNPEIRFFVKDHKVQCWHWYWVKEAIKTCRYHNPPLPADWEARMDAVINGITKEELKELTKWAGIVAKEFDGAWSCDFCRGKDKTWYLIDMAKAEVSYHPLPCEAIK